MRGALGRAALVWAARGPAAHLLPREKGKVEFGGQFAISSTKGEVNYIKNKFGSALLPKDLTVLDNRQPSPTVCEACPCDDFPVRPFTHAQRATWGGSLAR